MTLVTAEQDEKLTRLTGSMVPQPELIQDDDGNVSFVVDGLEVLVSERGNVGVRTSQGMQESAAAVIANVSYSEELRGAARLVRDK